jgi:hypothetical protein
MKTIHQNNLWKVTLYILLVVLSVTASPVTGMDAQQLSDQNINVGLAEVDETFQVYLPFSLGNYISDYYWRSPFSISIAALHQLFLTAPPDVDVDSDTTPFSTLIDAFHASGATGTRVELKWSVVQPDELANYNWSWYDRVFGLLSQSGIQMLVTVELANEWAVDLNAPACAPIDPEHYDEMEYFLQALVARYTGAPYNVKFWEIDNEPDSTADWGEDIGQGCWGLEGDRYAEALWRAYNAVKLVDPYATVLMGGLAYDSFIEYGGDFYRYFADEMMENGGGNYLDIQNIHYFTDFRKEWERWNSKDPTCGLVEDDAGLTYDGSGIDVIAKAKHYKNRMLVCHAVDKPLWITEIAASSGRENNHDLDWQARYVPQVYARSLSVQVGNISWYGLTTPNQADEQGLLYEDFSPKPSFFAYQAMTKQLDGSRFHRTLSAPGIEGYAFRMGTGVEKLLLWKLESLTAISSEYNLTPATRVLVVDYLGNEKIIVDGGTEDLDGLLNRMIKLQVTEDPIYVTIIAP